MMGEPVGRQDRLFYEFDLEDVTTADPSLAIVEKALGPEHPDVAQILENYAALLRETGRADEAERMDARAKVIRAKYQ